MRALSSALLAILALLALACTGGDGGGEDGYSLAVVRDGEVLARWTVERVEA